MSKYSEGQPELAHVTAAGLPFLEDNLHTGGVQHEGRSLGYLRYVKRPLDILLVLVALPAVLMIVLACAAVIFARDGSNPFYSQPRVGRGGRVFRIWKLRTMVVDADSRLAVHLARDAEARREWDEKQKLRDDPRVTPFGHQLRKTSLDELPQLFNVLLGDMSLVGPRPMMPSQKGLYSGRSYFHLRPGITGSWQVSSRNSSAFSSRVWYDENYWNTVSMMTDLLIILRTGKVLVRGTGM